MVSLKMKKMKRRIFMIRGKRQQKKVGTTADSVDMADLTMESTIESIIMETTMESTPEETDPIMDEREDVDHTNVASLNNARNSTVDKRSPLSDDESIWTGSTVEANVNVSNDTTLKEEPPKKEASWTYPTTPTTTSSEDSPSVVSNGNASAILWPTTLADMIADANEVEKRSRETMSYVGTGTAERMLEGVSSRDTSMTEERDVSLVDSPAFCGFTLSW
mmetsp:Transcript_6944/g.17151  ORF Transcript_6944/g.17151 Transcript_6944/m.17151 type:complete len:220 (+) Transcript_6944:118-777(+)